MLTDKSHKDQVKAMKYALAGGNRSINWDWPLFPARVFIFGVTGEILTKEQAETIKSGKSSDDFDFFAPQNDQKNLRILLFSGGIVTLIMIVFLAYVIHRLYGLWG